jgi:LAS superfamily LD-carboxypeptidase LdcB
MADKDFKMKKLLILSLLLVSSSSFAQTTQMAKPDVPMQTVMSSEDRAAHAEGRIAAFKATLKLTAEQEKLWPAAESAMREDLKARIIRSTNRQEMRERTANTNPIERLKTQSATMIESGNRTKLLAEALTPLYNTLDEAQKRRFAQLLSWENRFGAERPNFREKMREERNAPPK